MLWVGTFEKLDIKTLLKYLVFLRFVRWVFSKYVLYQCIKNMREMTFVNIIIKI